MFSHPFNPALFDIKIKSPHKNLLLLRGNEFECENVLLEGTVKLSISEDTHIKKVKLVFIGEYLVNFFERMNNGSILAEVNERLCVLKVDWYNLLTSPVGVINYGSYGDKFVRYNKIGSIKKSRSGSITGVDDGVLPGVLPGVDNGDSPALSRTRSGPAFGDAHHRNGEIVLPLSGVDGTPFVGSDQNSYLLPKGNYNLPFRVLLPSNISETVEGLSCGSLLYKIGCTIERGKFEKDVTIMKHIRIVRTLHPQNFNLTDSIDIYNTWPEKVDYNVNIAKKGLAIGSSIPINIIIVPIAKGLSIRKIHGCIVQHYHVMYEEGTSPEYEQLHGKQNMPIPDQETLPDDKWTISTHYKVPENLARITQSCVLKNNIIQVRHRLRVCVQLNNKEGHTSELRANLPVYLYISANAGHVRGKHLVVEPELAQFINIPDQLDTLFKKHHEQNGSQSPMLSANEDGEEEPIDENDLDRLDAAPPLYQKHVFDKVYDMNSPKTPLEQFRNQSVSPSPLLSPIETRNNIDSCIDSDLPPRRNSDVPSSPRLAINGKPFVHKELDVNTLCRVPTYDEAVENDIDDPSIEEPAPLYPDLRGLHSSHSLEDLSLRNFLTPARALLARLERADQFRGRGAVSMPHSPLARSPIRAGDEDSISTFALSDTSRTSSALKSHHILDFLHRKK